MRYSKYSVSIDPGNEQEGYVYMKHNTTYKILLKNEDRDDASASVYIDGKHIDDFFIKSYSKYEIETKPFSGKQFTFFKADSKEGKASKLDKVSEDNMGLISVTFTPGRKKVELMRKHLNATAVTDDLSRGGQSVNSVGKLSKGGTGLTGQSNQQFHEVQFEPLSNKPPVTIKLRLVCSDLLTEEPTELKSGVEDISTPTPPPII